MNKFLNLINEQYIKLGDQYKVEKERNANLKQRQQELKILLDDFEQQQKQQDEKYQDFVELQQIFEQYKEEDVYKKICYNPNQSCNYELKVQIMAQKMQKIQNKIKQNTVDIQQFHDKELKNQQKIQDIQQQVIEVKQWNQILDDQNKKQKIEIKQIQSLNEQKQQDYDNEQKQQLQELRVNFDNQSQQIKNEISQLEVQKVKKINQQTQTIKQDDRQKQIQEIKQQQIQLNKQISLYQKKIDKYPISKLNPQYVKLKEIEQQEQIKEQQYNDYLINCNDLQEQINSQLEQYVDLQQMIQEIVQ